MNEKQGTRGDYYPFYIIFHYPPKRLTPLLTQNYPGLNLVYTPLSRTLKPCLARARIQEQIPHTDVIAVGFFSGGRPPGPRGRLQRFWGASGPLDVETVLLLVF
jgi:hypothetical protein